MSVEPSDRSVFDFRLEGGFTICWGPPRRRDGGMARIMGAPAFCDAPELAPYFAEDAKAQWEIWPIEAAARRDFADESCFVRIVDVDIVVRGGAFVQLSRDDRRVCVEVFLSDLYGPSGPPSAFEDWFRILRAVREDLNREARLLLKFPPDRLGPSDIAAFAAGQRLATVDVELSVRPRAIQWSRDD
jgi:hypothetical protein